ncbi:MAG: GlsB/YeaQ/YmgE family stress response membrane protein [Armatimonadetes bacterium]|nr:GlsB/YeaQ/YmgE family stress response membrane protein [Armatimonadota bacterium]
MHFVWFAVAGLIAGFLAKMIMPGDRNEPKGFVMTMLLGIVGAMVTGFVFRQVLGWNASGNFIGTIIAATAGACGLIWIANVVRRK